MVLRNSWGGGGYRTIQIVITIGRNRFNIEESVSNIIDLDLARLAKLLL